MSVFDIFVDSCDEDDENKSTYMGYSSTDINTHKDEGTSASDPRPSRTQARPISPNKYSVPSLFPTYPHPHAFGEYILDGGRADTFGSVSKKDRTPGMRQADSLNSCKFPPKKIRKKKTKGDRVDTKNSNAGNHNGSSLNPASIKNGNHANLPPPKYVCKICNIPGHYIQKCPNKPKRTHSKKSAKNSKLRKNAGGSPTKKVVKQDCIFWAKGSCQNGDKCTFSHDKEPACGDVVCKFHISGNCVKGTGDSSTFLFCCDNYPICDDHPILTKALCVCILRTLFQCLLVFYAFGCCADEL